MPSTLLIYNPIAGRGRTQRHLPLVEAALRAAQVDFEAVASQAPHHALELAQQAPGRYATVAGMGGDGTIHEIANGLLRASNEGETIPMGVIPLGNGDDFAKMIPPETPVGDKPFDYHLAVDKIAAMQTRLFDVGRISGGQGDDEVHYFINGMDVGFGAHAALNLAAIPKFVKGLPAYLAALVRTLVAYPDLQIRLQFDDQQVIVQPTTMTAIMNGRCFGSGFWVCPDAQVDDGTFDLMVGQKVGRLTILRLVPKFMRGTHTDDPVLWMARARHIVIDSETPLVVETDGEIPYRAARHLEVQILDRRLRVIV